MLLVLAVCSIFDVVTAVQQRCLTPFWLVPAVGSSVLDPKLSYAIVWCAVLGFSWILFVGHEVLDAFLLPPALEQAFFHVLWFSARPNL